MAWDLVNVEALPHDVLMRGVAWDWESFPQYMAATARRGFALNVGFLVPLSALRYYVIGERRPNALRPKPRRPRWRVFTARRSAPAPPASR